MQYMLNLLSLLIGLNAWALGPIPNGEYVGTTRCAPNMSDESKPQSTIIISDTTIKSNSQVNEFVIEPSGFFRMNAIEGVTGGGLGHFTQDGLHYEALFHFPDEDAMISIQGEDTFRYSEG
ncbi:MAG: hypothetical protein AB7H97_12390, partial [Pseudobdellovibrionaceae bacterium]